MPLPNRAQRRASGIVPTAALRLHCEGLSEAEPCPDFAVVGVCIGNAAKDGLSAQVLDRTLRSAGWALAVAGEPPNARLDPLCPACAKVLRERTPAGVPVAVA